ncbi:MAG: glycosyltransferase family 39 protein [Lachnospiraceae bacterium]
MENRKSSFRWEPFLILAATALFISFGLDTTQETLKSWQLLMALAAVLLLTAALCRHLPVNMVSVMIALGIFLKLAYVLYTATWTRQHDVIDFGTGEGHAGYIEYLLQNKALPDFDPRTVWAFFQPPLHHIIAAVWVKLCTVAGVTYRQAQENIQALTFCYTGSVMLFSYFTCKEIGLKKWGMRVAMLLISFHPIYVMLSGSINNDALSLALSAAALYLAVLWYQRPGLPVILLLGACIGLSMLAKLSGGVIAPAVAVLFLLKLIQERQQWKKYLVQFAAFALVVLPLGLWWTVRNMVLYHMPVNYIPPVGEQLEYTGIVHRLLDVRLHSVYPAMKVYGDAYDEYNVPLSLIKTSLFGEYNFGLEWKAITPFATVLFIAGVLLAIAAFAAMLHVLFSKKSIMKKEWKLLFGILYASLLGSYCSFAFGYSNFSAQDFRYVALIIVVEALFLGVFVDGLDFKKKRQRICGFLIIGAAAVFAASSCFVYLMLGFAR